MDISPHKPTLIDETKFNRIVQGHVNSFPGNANLMQYFSIGLAEGRIRGEKIAIIDDEATTTFNMLNDVSNRIAEALKAQIGSLCSQNPDGETIIGICMAPSDKLILTIFAILKLGAAYVPFDVAMPKDRIVRIVKDCRPVLVVSDSYGHTIRKFDPVKDLVKVVSYSDIVEMIENNKAELNEPEIITIESSSGSKVHSSSSEITALVLYTSGSTGVPKGVRISHRSVLNRLNFQWKALPFTPNERWAFKTSITFLDAITEIFGPLLQGYPTVIFSKTVVRNPSDFIQRLDFHKITLMFLVPSVLKAIFQTLKSLDDSERQIALTSLRLWMVGGEPVQKDLVEEFFEHFPKNSVLANFYGASEISDATYVFYESKEAVNDKSVDNQIPIGACLYNTIIYIVNDQMELVPENTKGEILIAGYNLATGYVGVGDSDKFINNPFSNSPGFTLLYRTGDFGRVVKTPDGTKMILYEGRTDAQVKVRGQKANLIEIQYALTQLPLVIKSVVLCYHPGLPDQTLVAFVVAEPEATAEKLREFLTDKLLEYEIPLVRLVPEIPYLINGKTDRQLLLRNFQQEREERGMFDDWDSLRIPKKNAVAGKILIETISEVTGRFIQDIVVDLDESFYNFGGTSLNSIEVILKLREHKYNILISDFVTAKTILEIIDHMVLVQNGEYESEKASEHYTIEKLSNCMYKDVAMIISHSFSHKGDLDAYNNTTHQDYSDLIQSLWKALVHQEFSFVARRLEDQKIVGASLNFDVYDEPRTNSLNLSKALSYDMELIEFIESAHLEKLPKGKGKLLHSSIMGTSEELDGPENVNVVQFMEENVIKMGKRMNFVGIFTTNTSALTKTIDRDILGYEVLEEYQVNQFIAPDGTKPFLLAPDTLKIMCCWKKLDNPACY